MPKREAADEPAVPAVPSGSDPSSASLPDGLPAPSRNPLSNQAWSSFHSAPVRIAWSVEGLVRSTRSPTPPVRSTRPVSTHPASIDSYE